MLDRDLPKVPDHREATYITLENAVLRAMIERTLFSVSPRRPGAMQVLLAQRHLTRSVLSMSSV